MNFVEFYENVQAMKEGCDLEAVDIKYVKFGSSHCLWAMDGDHLVSRFKW